MIFKQHRLCPTWDAHSGTVTELAPPLATCDPVIAECCYLLRSLEGAPEAVLQNVEGGNWRNSGRMRGTVPIMALTILWPSC